MIKKTIDVTALGELLIDFTEYGVSDQGNLTFEANPGGAPCNVLSMLAGLGKKVAFLGKVGDDMFGRILKDAICEQGIDGDGLSMDPEIHTTLAFVHKLENGDRDFSFYRKPGADMSLAPEDLLEEKIRQARIFHFGSLSLTDEPVRSAHHRAMEIAEEAGCIRSFDPNLREPLWDSLDRAKEEIAWGLAHCDVLKISDNEIQWFTGKEDFDEGIAALKEAHPQIKLICLSKGAEGSTAYCGGHKVTVMPFLNENTVETTGAGDTFCACVLNYVLEHGLTELSPENLKDMLTFANAAASIVTTRKGALRVMPAKEEVEALIAERA